MPLQKKQIHPLQTPSPVFKVLTHKQMHLRQRVVGALYLAVLKEKNREKTKNTTNSSRVALSCMIFLVLILSNTGTKSDQFTGKVTKYK